MVRKKASSGISISHGWVSIVPLFSGTSTSIVGTDVKPEMSFSRSV